MRHISVFGFKPAIAAAVGGNVLPGLAGRFRAAYSDHVKISKFLDAPPHSTFADVTLLAVRVVVGLAFMVHGWPKIRNPLGWMGPEGFAPGVFQALAAVSEFGGGLAWVLGLLTPLAALGIGSTMVVAVSYHAFLRGDPFVSATGGPAYELASVYFCIALLLIALGPGRFSLDRLLFRSPAGTPETQPPATATDA